MLIGEVSKKTGFSTDTIRWYEKIGLIKLDRKARTSNNYRNYDKETIDRLFSIKQLKTFGFTLKETEDLLILEAIDELKCPSVTTVVRAKMEVIDQKINELKELKAKLNTAKNACTGNCKEVLYN